MLTRLPLEIGEPPKDLNGVIEYLGKLRQTLVQYQRDLNRPGALVINEATFDGRVGSNVPNTGAFTTVDASGLITANAGLTFGDETLSVYDEDATGVDLSLTFATVGDLLLGFTYRKCYAVQIGCLVVCDFNIETSGFIHTTAAGALSITGFPFTSKNTSNRVFGCGLRKVQGITKAGYTHFGISMEPNATTAQVVASGSGVAEATIAAADMPTGGTVKLAGTLIYSV